MNPPLPQAVPPRRGRLPVLLLAFAVLVSAIVGGLAATAGAERAITLGKTKRTPQPDNNQVMGQVTGFQRSAAGKNGLFRVEQRGKIVAWSVDLGKPSKEDREVLNEEGGTERYGQRPTAGLAIIRKESRERYKLLRRSPIVRMSEYYGERPVITLEKPLRVRPDDIVAITTPTWLPNFAVEQSRQDVWVASRKSSECEASDIQEFFAQTNPHLKEGSTRQYGCKYDKARLLYWAYFVPNRRDGGGGGGGGGGGD